MHGRLPNISTPCPNSQVVLFDRDNHIIRHIGDLESTQTSNRGLSHTIPKASVGGLGNKQGEAHIGFGVCEPYLRRRARRLRF